MLALTLAGALTAIRGIPWFAFACMVFVPVAIGRSLESRRPAEPRRGLNLAISDRPRHCERASRREHSSCGATRSSRTTGRTGLRRAIQAELRPDDRVFVPDRFSDWLLWKIPELRGRIAYDVRFEVYDKRVLRAARRLQLGARDGDWKSFADGYRIVVVDETTRSHTADFLAEPGTRVIYKNDELTVIARPS